MNIKSFLFIVISICFTQALIAQDWKLFYSERGNFNIMTPGLMEEKVNSFETSVGEMEITTYLLKTPKDSSGNFLYLINFYDLPENTLNMDSLYLKNEMLLNAIDQNTEDISGELLYKNDIHIGEHPGYLWRTNYASGSLKSRAYIVNNRFYMIQVFTKKDGALNNDIDRFLESFTLLE